MIPINATSKAAMKTMLGQLQPGLPDAEFEALWAKLEHDSADPKFDQRLLVIGAILTGDHAVRDLLDMTANRDAWKTLAMEMDNYIKRTVGPAAPTWAFPT